MPADTVQGRLAAFLTSMSVAAVLDVAEARELALAEAAAEFVERCVYVLDAEWDVAHARGLASAAAATRCGGIGAWMCDAIVCAW